MACGLLKDGGLGGMHGVFADLENGIRKNDEELFKKHWTPAGYNKNLVGGSGMTGQKVFEQGSRKKWFLQAADIDHPLTEGKVEIFRCDVYLWEQSRKVDEIYLAVTKEDKKVLGGGEDLEEVKSLAARYNRGETLEPN
jgi:hypothetical protein